MGKKRIYVLDIVRYFLNIFVTLCVVMLLMEFVYLISGLIVKGTGVEIMSLVRINMLLISSILMVLVIILLLYKKESMLVRYLIKTGYIYKYLEKDSENVGEHYGFKIGSKKEKYLCLEYDVLQDTLNKKYIIKTVEGKEDLKGTYKKETYKVIGKKVSKILEDEIEIFTVYV